MNHFEQLGTHVGEIDNLLDAWIHAIGLSYNHFAVLYTLGSSPDRQCTQKQICEEYYLPKQTVFNICKEYREKGWIEFFPSDTDKRERIMRLTEQGKTAAQPVVERTNDICSRTFAAFGEEKTRQLFALMSEFCQVAKKQLDQEA